MHTPKTASQQPPGVDPPPLLQKAFETGLLAPSDPSPPPLQPPLISVRQLYMLGLTISPETRVRVVTPSTHDVCAKQTPGDIKIHHKMVEGEGFVIFRN